MELSQELILQTIAQVSNEEDFLESEIKHFQTALTSTNRDTYIVENALLFCKTPLIKELYYEPAFIDALFTKILRYNNPLIINNILKNIAQNLSLNEFYNENTVIDHLLDDFKALVAFSKTDNFFSYFTSPNLAEILAKLVQEKEFKLNFLTKIPLEYVTKLLGNRQSRQKVGQLLINDSSILHDNPSLASLCWSTYQEEFKTSNLKNKLILFKNLPTSSLKEEAFNTLAFPSYLNDSEFLKLKLDDYLSQDELLKLILQQSTNVHYERLLSFLDSPHQLTFIKKIVGDKHAKLIYSNARYFKDDTLKQLFLTMPSLIPDSTLVVLYNKTKDQKYLEEIKKRYLTLPNPNFLPNVLYSDVFVNLLTSEERQVIINKFDPSRILLPQDKTNYNKYFFQEFTKKNLAYLNDHPATKIYLSVTDLLNNYSPAECFTLIKHFSVVTIINQITTDNLALSLYQKVLLMNPELLQVRLNPLLQVKIFEQSDMQNFNVILAYLTDEQITELYQLSLSNTTDQDWHDLSASLLCSPKFPEKAFLPFLSAKGQEYLLNQLNPNELLNLLSFGPAYQHPVLRKVIEEKLITITTFINHDQLVYAPYSNTLFPYLDHSHQQSFIVALTNLTELKTCLDLASNDEDLTKMILDQIIKTYEKSCSNVLPSSKKPELLLSKYDDRAINYFITNMSLAGFFHLLEYGDNTLAITQEIMKRLKKNSGLLLDEEIYDTLDLFMNLLNEEDKSYLTNLIDSQIQACPLYQKKYLHLFPSLSFLAKINFLNLVHTNLLEANAKLFNQLSQTNPYLLETVRQIIFDPLLKKINYQFLAQISRYPWLEKYLGQIKEMKALNFLVLASQNLEKNNYTSSAYAKAMNILITTLVSSNQFQNFNFSVINSSNITDIINYLFYDFLDQKNKSTSKYKSITQMFSFKITNFTEERRHKCDKLFKQSNDIEELKNLYLNKYLSISLVEAQLFLSHYASNYYKVSKYAQNTNPSMYIELISEIIKTNDVVTLKSLYENASISYDLNDRFSIEDTIKDAYYKSVVEEYKPPKNGHFITKTYKIDDTEIPVKMTEYTDDFNLIIYHASFPNLIANDYFLTLNNQSLTGDYVLPCQYLTNLSYNIKTIFDGLIFVFSNLKKENILAYSPYPLGTCQNGLSVEVANLPYYTSLKELPSFTRSINEIILDPRDYSPNSHSFYLQPTALIILNDMPITTITKTIQAYEDFKKHGLQLDLLYLDREKIAQNEATKLATLIKDYEEKVSLATLKEILNLHASNLSSCQFLSELSRNELFMTTKVNELLTNTLSYISNQPSKARQLTTLNEFIKILTNEQAKFTIAPQDNNQSALFSFYSKELKEKIINLKQTINKN